MKRLLPALLAAGVLVACGSESPTTPTACLQGNGAYLRAVKDAPQSAELEPGVPISACLVPDQPSSQLGTVGSAVVAAATALNAEAARDPDGRAATQLGYLVGAVEEGASGTAGIHTDLVRRINSAARFSENDQGLGAEFERTYGAGYAAARAAG